MDYNLTSRSGISLERIRSFILVAETGSMTRAAQGDTNAQTQFSRQIKDLENYFGTELFHRKGRTIELTESGTRLLRIAKEFFANLEDYAEECQLDQRDIRIGAGDSFIQWLFIPQLMKLKASTDDANLSFKNLNTEGMLKGLLDGDIHFALMRDVKHPDLRSVRVGEVAYRLFTPKKLKRKGTDLGDVLNGLPLAGMEGNGRFQQSMDSLIRKHGLFVKYAVRCSSFPMMAKAVDSLGVGAVLPEIASKELKASSSMTLDGLEILNHELFLCWNAKQESVNERMSEDAEALVSVLSAAIGA